MADAAPSLLFIDSLEVVADDVYPEVLGDVPPNKGQEWLK